MITEREKERGRERFSTKNYTEIQDQKTYFYSPCNHKDITRYYNIILFQTEPAPLLQGAKIVHVRISVWIKIKKIKHVL